VSLSEGKQLIENVYIVDILATIYEQGKKMVEVTGSK
jgi:hypothetical protein